jgi:hypothetical protein
VEAAVAQCLPAVEHILFRDAAEREDIQHLPTLIVDGFPDTHLVGAGMYSYLTTNYGVSPPKQTEYWSPSKSDVIRLQNIIIMVMGCTILMM